MASTGATGPSVHAGRRTRRFDPQRRDHILRTALDVLVEHGAGGLTQRLVAAAADVPLGSVTYHFSSRNDLVHAAFARFVEEQKVIFERLVGALSTRAELQEALVDLVDGGQARDRAGVLGFELYLAALREPRLRTLTEEWTAASRSVLARAVDGAAADLDAYLEGLILHSLLSREAVPRSVTHRSVSRFLEAIPMTVRGRDE